MVIVYQKFIKHNLFITNCNLLHITAIVHTVFNLKLKIKIIRLKENNSCGKKNNIIFLINYTIILFVRKSLIRKIFAKSLILSDSFDLSKKVFICTMRFNFQDKF